MSTRSDKIPVTTNEVTKFSGSTEPKDNILVTETLGSANNSTYLWSSQLNQSTITTGFYILAGVSSIIVLYFVLRAIRLRRRNYKVRRYGVIASREDVEMTPLENEDDDEDSTVFDISVKTHSRS